MNKLTLPKGLTKQQVDLQRRTFGFNDLTPKQKNIYWITKFNVLREPMILLMGLTAVIYFVMGDWAEGLLLALSVLVAVSLTLYQEYKSEKALASLKDLSSPRALVLREGLESRIPAKDLVPEDIIVLHEGDRIPADSIVLESNNFTIDESLLTGESFAVKKDESIENRSIYASTLVISGSAIAKVIKIGLETRVGQIGKILNEEVEEDSNLAIEIKQIVKIFAWICLVVCLCIVTIYGLLNSDWTQATLVGLATAMSLLPEEFPVVYTVFIALGAWRLSKVNVLMRKPSAIERLGAINYLCVDKTGTLTKNQMSISMLANSSNMTSVENQLQIHLPESYHDIIEYGILASHKDPFDPMEKAILRLAEENPWGREHIHDWELIKDYPLSSQLLAMSCVWKSSSDAEYYYIASKGAPEAVVDLCHLEKNQSNAIFSQVKEMANNGLRVLGVAKAKFPKEQLPTDQHSFHFEWVGLIGLSDPIRVEVPKSVLKCKTAGINVMMMTGDYPETALKIAAQAGLINTTDFINDVITGNDISKLTDEALYVKLKSTHVFARMTPENKLRIVKVLRNKNQVVAMTGDGVNDAPSLKWANVGISMGARGTDVARESSDIVLLNDDFSSIVKGIERGRIIFKNIKNAMAYIVSIHVPIAGLAILPVIFNWPLILLPMHIVFLELIIDPACSILFEAQKNHYDVMSDKPRKIDERFFSSRDFSNSFIQGFIVLIVLTFCYYKFLNVKDGNELYARTMVFYLLVMSNISLIFNRISNGNLFHLSQLIQSKINFSLLIGVILTLVLGVTIPMFRTFFKLSSLNIMDVLTICAISLILFLLLNFIVHIKRYLLKN